MEDQHVKNAAPQNAAPGVVTEHEVLPVSESVEVAVGIDENQDAGDDHREVAVSVASNGGAEVSGKRKRGRPKKQLGGEVAPPVVFAPEFSVAPQKRGRGRPRGSGKWQTMAASLGYVGGTDFTPYVLTIEAGENIVQNIWSFSQSVPDSICILSASGTISSAEICLPSSCGSIIRYEGNFTIVNLNGSHAYNDKWGVRTKHCHLSIQLANPEGRLYGGVVAGSLIAASATLLVIATFRQSREKLSLKRRLQLLKPNKATVPVPSQMSTNGKLPDNESYGFPGLPPVPGPISIAPADEVVMNNPDVGPPSPQSLFRLVSKAATSEVDTGAAD